MELHLHFAGFHEAPLGQDMPFHTHQEWELVLYCGGIIQTVLGTETYDTAPGILVLTPPGIPHAEYALTPYANIYLGVDAPADHPWPRTCVDDADQSLGHLFRSVAHEWLSQHPDRAVLLHLLLQQLDLLLRRAASTQACSAAEKLVADAERYIQEQYHRPLTIGEIASTLGISPATLRQHFAPARLRADGPLAAPACSARA